MTDEMQLCVIGLAIILAAGLLAHLVYVLLFHCDCDDR